MPRDAKPSVPGLQTSATPTFVVGAERSGSTLLRLMLDQHSKLSFSHQMEFLVDYTPPGQPHPEVLDLIGKLAGDAVFRRSKLEVGAYPFRNARELIESLLYQRGEGCVAIGGTVHRHFARMLDHWPHARFIHLVRDPRAVAPSAVRMGWDGTPYAAAERWVESEQEWDALRDRLDDDAWTEVRFEDLATRSEEALTGLCEFMGVEYEPALLEFHQHSTYSKVDGKIADAWRKNPTQWARDVEMRAGDMMLKRGYMPEVQDVPEVGSLEIAALTMRERVMRTKLRQERMGVELWAKSLVARRLRRWVEKVHTEQADAESAFIK